ncbi:amidohydrolase [uncultured Enterococcus sp.]|uniref:amidohydrolase n=1 Tax=uncultured Enterococcus sp. TaxID=167972 RepID=UPI0025F2B636|nr:amidohydrolase [uncultured Enterococcus sp.]
MTTQLIYNSTILTMDAQQTIFQNGYVYLEGSVIKQIGNMKDAFIPEAEIMIDGQKGILMPGMINTHTHCGMIPFRSLGDDVPDRLRRFLFPLEQKMTPELVYASSKYAMAEMLLAGVTTFADMYYFEEEVAKAAEAMSMRGFVGETIIDMPVCDAETVDRALKNAEQLIQKWHDHPLITPMIAPHAPNTNTTEGLKKVQQLAQRYKVPVMMHVAEMDYEMDYFQEKFGQTPIRYLESLDFFTQRFILVHAIFANKDDLDCLANYTQTTTIAHCIGANTKSAKGVAPVSTMLTKNLTVGLGTDGPSSGNTLDLFTQMRMFANIHKTTEKNRACFKAEEIVALATSSGAKVLGIEDQVGSIEIGKQADLTLVETQSVNMFPIYDPYAVLVYSANSGNVHSVWVNGKQVVKDKQLIEHRLSELRTTLDHQMTTFRQAAAVYSLE